MALLCFEDSERRLAKAVQLSMEMEINGERLRTTMCCL